MNKLIDENVYEEMQCAPPSEKYEEIPTGNYHVQVCEARNEALVLRKLPPEY